MNDLSSLLDQSSYLRLISENVKLRERATSAMSTDKTEYTSCIRINGRPILPPVMTPGRRLECLEWKRKALEVEERLGAKRREKILATIRSLKTTTSSASAPSPSQPSPAPLANQDIQQNLTDNVESTPNLCTFGPDLTEESQGMCQHRVPSAQETSLVASNDQIVSTSLRSISAIVETPNFVHNGNAIDHSEINGNTEVQDKKDLREEIVYVETESFESNQEENLEDTEEEREDVTMTPTVQRKRRGSYTLDEPSPLLLAYMERFGENFSGKNSGSVSSTYTT